MFSRFINSFRRGSVDRQLLQLAKTEFGRDWEWAYHELLQGRMPTKGVTQ